MDMASPSVPAARIVHRTPGRLRLRIAERIGDAAWFDEAALSLAMARGIIGVRTAARTGSILISHRGEAAAIIDEAVRAGLFTLADADDPAGDAPAWQGRADAARTAFETLAWNSQATAAAGFLLLAAALLQARRGNIMPPAVSLLVYAMGALLSADRLYHAAHPRAGGAASQASGGSDRPT